MTQVLHVTIPDEETLDWIEKEAERKKISMEMVVQSLIYRGLEVERDPKVHKRYHDLDGLAGTWTSEEVAEFQESVADFSQIDRTLWRE